MVILYCKIGDKKDMKCLKYSLRCGACLISEQRLGALVDLIVSYSFFLWTTVATLFVLQLINRSRGSVQKECQTPHSEPVSNCCQLQELFSPQPRKGGMPIRPYFMTTESGQHICHPILPAHIRNLMSRRVTRNSNEGLQKKHSRDTVLVRRRDVGNRCRQNSVGRATVPNWAGS